MNESEIKHIKKSLEEAITVIESLPFLLNTANLKKSLTIISGQKLDCSEVENNYIKTIIKVSHSLTDQEIEEILTEELPECSIYDVKLLRNLLCACFINLYKKSF